MKCSIMSSLRLLALVSVGIVIARSAFAAEPLPSEKNSLGMTLLHVPPGEFNRGTTDEQKLRKNHPNTIEQGADLVDERPPHPVRLTQGFGSALTK